MKSTARKPCCAYPQSGERIRGWHNIQESWFVQPNKKRFTVRRITGNGDLWVTEFVLAYDGIPILRGEHHGTPRRTGGQRERNISPIGLTRAPHVRILSSGRSRGR